jgi:nucleotide-binding universal stress UspA family protein
MRLLVGFDGSDGGHDALELARAIAVEDDETSVLVVTVMPYGPLPADFEALAGDAAAEAESLFTEARERLGELSVETRGFGGGSPAKVLTELAEGEGIDLIVVGSPHRGAVGRALIGSVADNLLHGSPRPVVVAPRGYAGERHEPFRRIAVGHDGTPEADAALRAAEALALRSNALIDVLTVLAPPAVTPGPVGYAPSEPPEPDKILNQAIHAVDERLGATGRRLDGPPARMLAGACEDAGLLVVGSRGYGPVLRVLLGSVSTRLIHIAPCPVLVIPRPDPAAD